MKNIVIILSLLIPLSIISPTLYAYDNVELELSASSSILIEQSTGRVLYENDADLQLAPASITKIMTMLLVLEAIENGQVSLDDTVTTSSYASSMGGSQIWLRDGEQMSLSDMLKAVAVASANDAATALAEHISGSKEQFVQLMNTRAIELGMTNTTFKNPTGLDEEGHLSTARDIAIMSSELLSHDIIREYSSIWMDSLRGGDTQLVNTNKLVRFYNGATGLKTGTTDDAGNCVSASAMRDGMEIIAVVLGCPNSVTRFEDATSLLNYGFANYIKYETHTSNDIIQPVPVLMGVADFVEVETTVLDSIIVPISKQNDIVEDIAIFNSVTAPVYKGDRLGEIIISIDNEVIERFYIVASHDVQEASFMFRIGEYYKALFR